jgi:hypothetical protein
VTEAEIFWPSSLPAGPALEAEALLREAGVDATCRLQPVRRGTESVLVLLTTVTVEPFLGAVFERYAAVAEAGLRSAEAGLRHFVSLLFRRLHKEGAAETAAETPGENGPKVVVFESANGAQFLFTPNLPVDAYRKAVQIGPSPRKGRWMWDGDNQNWLCFENR